MRNQSLPADQFPHAYFTKCVNVVYFIRGKLYDLSCESWNNELDEDIRQKMACMATSAAWGLGKTIC